MEWPLFFLQRNLCRKNWLLQGQLYAMSDHLCDWRIIILSNRILLLLQFQLRLDYGLNRWTWVWHKRIQDRNAIIVVVVYSNAKWIYSSFTDDQSKISRFIWFITFAFVIKIYFAFAKPVSRPQRLLIWERLLLECY